MEADETIAPLNAELSVEQTKELLVLCRAGKLYEIERWISAGRPLAAPTAISKSPLEVAVEVGFHSLVELLARHERSKGNKNKALRRAVQHRRREIVELLIGLGTDPRAVPFLEVLETWDPALIRLFVDKGADVVSNTPFAFAFGERIRKALRPMMELRATRSDIAAELQEQADQALRYFAHEGDLKWVSLMLWAGANPRSKGRRLYDRDDPELYSTAMEEACYSGNVDVLKKFKPSQDRDNLTELLACTSALSKGDALAYLLGIGASPNDRPNGGSSVLYRCLLHLDWENFHLYSHEKSNRKRDRYDVRRSLECAAELVRHGAQLVIDDDSEAKSIARSLCQCDNRVIIDILKMLVENKAASPEALTRLLSRPSVRNCLEPEQKKLLRLGLKLPDNGKRPKQPPFPHHMLARYDRDQLYRQVWSTPMQQLAKEYKMSDVGLAKACKLMRIPVPGRGYWAKKAAGRSVPKRPALPPVPCAHSKST